MLAGLGIFALGFAVAAVFVLAGAGGGPGYLIAAGVGMAGIVILGVAMSRRSNVPMPSTPIWSPATLRLLAGSAGLPATPVLVAFYVLVGFGVLGNLVIPLAGR